jgi:hypothetical protein
MSEIIKEFVPKIVRWGKRFGATNAAKGNFIVAYQRGTGKNNNNQTRTNRNRTYRNAKLDRLSHASSVNVFNKVAKRV